MGQDPAATNVFSTAITWIQALLIGRLATAVAIIAVASVGFLLISGRIDVRRGAQVIVGCFILFGASTIASGIWSAASGTSGSPAMLPATMLPPPPPSQPALPASPYDPYAGAAMPQRR